MYIYDVTSPLRWLETHREYHWNAMVRAKATLSKYCCLFCNKRAGTYLTSYYLFVKMVYVANVISQFFILNGFMSMDYNLYGFEVSVFLHDEFAQHEYKTCHTCYLYIPHVYF